MFLRSVRVLSCVVGVGLGYFHCIALKRVLLGPNISHPRVLEATEEPPEQQDYSSVF